MILKLKYGDHSCTARYEMWTTGNSQTAKTRGPVADGLAIADGRLHLSTEDGKLTSFGMKQVNGKRFSSTGCQIFPRSPSG